jgi:hypothetical protein
MSETGYSTTILKTNISAEHIVDYSIGAMFQPDTVGTIDWGDGTVTEASGSPVTVTHTYAAAGKYTIRIGGIHMLYMAGYDTKSIVYPEIQMKTDHTNIERTADTLEEVIINDRLLEIQYGSFMNCTLLETITIPASVTSIGDRAFGDCTGLKTVYCNAVTPPSWYIPGTGTPDPFRGCTGLTAIYVPKEAVNAYKSAAGWSTYANIIRRYPMTTITDRIATIEVDGSETVKFAVSHDVYGVYGEDIIASLKEGAGAGDEGAYSTAGTGKAIIAHYTGADTLYLTGSGTVTVWAGQSPLDDPFAV